VINEGKTKDLVVDFGRSIPAVAPAHIQGTAVRMVASFKCLGVHLDNRLE